MPQLKLKMTCSKGLLDWLKNPVAKDQIEGLADKIDHVYFGEGGILAKDIKNQSSSTGSRWRKLSKPYLDWKTHMMKTGIDTSDSIPPKKVVSTDIWIRTGKALEVTKTIGSGRLKTMKVNWRNFATAKGSPLIEWKTNLDYVQVANARRPLFEHSEFSRKKINLVLSGFAAQIKARYALMSHKGGKIDLAAELI